MSRKVIIILAVVLLLCGCAGGALFAVLQAGRQALSRAVITDADAAATAARAIADYDLPTGYKEQMGLNLFGVSMVAIASDASRPMVMLMQMPKTEGVDPKQVELQFQQAMQSQMSKQNLKMRVVGYRDVTIRGQAVKLAVSEGTGGQDVSMREETGPFQGKGGLAYIVILGPKATWNEAIVDAFLASMR